MKNLVCLFDIDGTLIRTGGAGQLAIESVVTKPGAGDHQIPFSGRTDRGIIADFFREFSIEDTEQNYAAYKERFLGALDGYLAECQGQVLPRVVETLEHVMNQPGIGVGLITGNMRKAAKKKLLAYGLGHFFFEDRPEGIGGFGDDHRDRDDVARDALQETRDFLQPDVDPCDVWVIGDTPNDVKCARAIGAKVVAVATGSYSLSDLHAANADFTIESLDHAQAWWEHLADCYDVASPSFAGSR